MKVFIDANICLDLLDSTRNASKNSIAWGFDNFEDLIILHSGIRLGCERFLTNDKRLLQLNSFESMIITFCTP